MHSQLGSFLRDNLILKNSVAEYEPSMIAKFKEGNKYSVKLVCSDYLAFDAEAKYDAIVCNPPYIEDVKTIDAYAFYEN